MNNSDFITSIKEIEKGNFICFTGKEFEEIKGEMDHLDKLRKRMKSSKFESQHKRYWIKYEIMEAITSERIKKGYTQQNFAKKIGVSRSMLKRIENGSYDVKLSILKKIAAGLDKRLHIEFR